MYLFKTLITGTISGLRISAVDGTAFLDNCAVLVPYANGLRMVTIFDSSRRMLTGWLKEAGTGETFGSEKISNPSFDVDTSGWDASNCTIASISGGLSGKCLELTATGGGSQSAFCAVSLTTDALYKGTTYVKSGTSGNEAARVYFDGTIQYVSGTSSTTTSDWTIRSVYITRTDANTFRLNKYTSTIGTMLFDEASVKQVLTTSTNGVKIVSTQGGSTYNFATKDASFTYNAASYAYAIHDLVRV